MLFSREGEGNINKSNNTKIKVGDTRKTLLHYALAHTCIGSWTVKKERSTWKHINKYLKKHIMRKMESTDYPESTHALQQQATTCRCE